MAKRFIEGPGNSRSHARKEAQEAKNKWKPSKKELRAQKKQEQRTPSQRKRHSR